MGRRNYCDADSEQATVAHNAEPSSLCDVSCTYGVYGSSLLCVIFDVGFGNGPRGV